MVNGKCERCGTVVKKREKEQWLIKITKYADKLVKDLDSVDYPLRVKDQQVNWIGRSEGAEIDFSFKNSKEKIKVFTTRPDTLFGCTFLVLSPGHPVLANLKFENAEEVKTYILSAKNKSDLQRQEQKDKTGVELKGIKAINPENKKEIPIFVADYVMMGYGTGAVMAVPAHDQRDFEFAHKYKLPIKEVVLPEFGQKKPNAVFRESVGAVITRMPDNKILVVLNKKSNKWSIPGGGRDGGDDDRTTLMREVTEETGYTDFEIQEYLGQISTNFFASARGEERTKFQKVYHVVLKSDNSIPVKLEAHEHMEVHWMSPGEAIKKMDSNTSNSYESEFVKRFLQPSLVCFSGEGVLVNSGKFDGMNSEKAKAAITELIGAKKTVQYKLRDWVFSRQHYWGEPIPMIFCEKCSWQPVPEKDLPVELPKVKKYQPTDTGESPLAAMEKWVDVKCSKCKGPAKRETDTMPNWAGSNWYYLRYIDPKNAKNLANEKTLKYWMPVDWYNGGMEHTTLHLLYSRFIFKFLWDIGAVPKQIGNAR